MAVRAISSSIIGRKAAFALKGNSRFSQIANMTRRETVSSIWNAARNFSTRTVVLRPQSNVLAHVPWFGFGTPEVFSGGALVNPRMEGMFDGTPEQRVQALFKSYSRTRILSSVVGSSIIVFGFWLGGAKGIPAIARAIGVGSEPFKSFVDAVFWAGLGFLTGCLVMAYAEGRSATRFYEGTQEIPVETIASVLLGAEKSGKKLSVNSLLNVSEKDTHYRQVSGIRDCMDNMRAEE